MARGAAAMRERGGDFEGVRDVKLFFEYQFDSLVTMKKKKKNSRDIQIFFFFNVSWHLKNKIKYDVACHVRYFIVKNKLLVMLAFSIQHLMARTISTQG